MDVVQVVQIGIGQDGEETQVTVGVWVLGERGNCDRHGSDREAFA